MTKLLIPFESPDFKQETLTYELHDHPIAARWKNLVISSQRIGASYRRNEVFYGGNFFSIQELTSEIEKCLGVASKAFPENWKKSLFDPIRSDVFIPEQKNLNLAHVFFEEVFPAEKAKENGDVELLLTLSLLNRTIHRVEANLSCLTGFFIEANLMGTFFSSINPEENKYFSLDRKWGELYLSYCHVGESYLEVYRNRYPVEPTPQTLISGNVIMGFQKDAPFREVDQLQQWLNEYFKKPVEMQELPLGNVPLASLSGDWTPSSIEDFFKTYPHLSGPVRFE